MAHLFQCDYCGAASPSSVFAAIVSYAVGLDPAHSQGVQQIQKDFCSPNCFKLWAQQEVFITTNRN